MESKVSYIVKENIKHVKYDNLYFIDNEYQFLTTIPYLKLQPVYTMGGALDRKYNKRFKLLPIIKLFSDIEELKKYVHQYNITTVYGITNCLTHYWDHNISHGLFDSLYPLYLTLLRFYNEKEKFNILIDVIKIPGWKFPGHASREYNIEIFKTFSKGEILFKKKNYKFNVLIAGSGIAGISGVNKVGIMPGKDISALDKFRDRMFEVYDIKPKPAVNKQINILIIKSDRYTNSEMTNLNKLNQFFNSKKGLNSRMISWYNIKSFKEQLVIMNSTDIHISGAGSSMLNFPFLNKGKTHINLGVNEINPIEKFGKDVCTMPGLLEVNICLLSNSIYVEFFDIYKYGSIQYDPLIEIVNHNITNLNVSKVTKIPNFVIKWRKLCNDKPEKMEKLIKRMTYPESNYPDLIPVRFMDIVVSEFSPYGNKKIYNDDLL
jgi:hypothetical protein